MDIYSLGCVLWEALTGRVPFERDSAVARMFAHAHDPPPSLSDARPGLPPALDGVVARAMAKQPEDRYLSAGNLGDAALAAVEGRAIELSERSVAVGAAAPGAPTVAAPPAPTVVSERDGSRRRSRRLLGVDIRSVHAQLIGMVKQMRSDVADAAAAASFGDNAVYKATPKQLEQDTNELDSLADDFRAKGYTRLSLGAG